jgi:hypothetical protein
MKIWFELLFLKCYFRYFIILLKLFLDIKIAKNHLILKLFQIDFYNHFSNFQIQLFEKITILTIF